MQAIKRSHLIAAIVSPFWLLASTAGAADPAWSCASNAPALRVEVRHEGGPGQFPAYRAYVTAGTNKFAFLMPAGFRLDASDTQSVTLVSADYNCLLTWRILGQVPPESPDLDPAACREVLMQRRPGAKVQDEFTLPALGRRGPAFELRWNAKGGVPRYERVAFIPALAGVLEFSLASSPERFKAALPAFDLLLLSFRASDAKGKLVVPMLSNKL